MKIAVTGGNGLLASELGKINSSLTLFSKKEVDITKPETFNKFDKFDIILHPAARIDVSKIKGNEKEFIDVNIVGTANIAKYCLENNKRLIYISTDYVYSGKGNHKENEPILPYNIYSWSKIGGEASVRFLNDYLIIRTSFGPSKFPYEYAYENLYTSKDYVDIIAPLINKAVMSNLVGTVNVGNEKKSIHQWASKRNQVKKGKLEKEMYFSLNLDKFNSI